MTACLLLYSVAADSLLPKQVLCSQVVEGKGAPGGQKKRYKDNIKTNLKKYHIDLKTWKAKTIKQTNKKTDRSGEPLSMRVLYCTMMKTRAGSERKEHQPNRPKPNPSPPPLSPVHIVQE